MNRTQYQESLAKLNQKIKEVDELIERLESAKATSEEVIKSSTDLRAEIANLSASRNTAAVQLTAINNLHNQLTSVKTQIDAQQKEASDGNAEISRSIKNYEVNYNSWNNKVNELYVRVESLAKSVDETLNIATSSALSKGFSERAEKAAISRKGWAKILIAYLTIIGIAVVYLSVFDVAGKRVIDFTDLWDLKSIPFIPFIYLLYFLVRQFNRSRDLEEKYTFKALMSQTLENNVKLLKDEFGDGSNSERLKFAISTMQSVYRDPIKQTVLSIWLESRFAKFGVKEDGIKDKEKI